MVSRSRLIAAFGSFFFAVILLSGAGGGYTTGQPRLDKLLASDPGEWGRLVGADSDPYFDELRKLNPNFDRGAKESITTPIQKIVLSLFALQRRDGVIIELGSWTGGGALLMAPFLTRDAAYHAVDTFDAENMPDKYIRNYLRGRKHIDVFKENVAPVSRKVVMHQGLTNEVVKTWPRDLKADLLFIDADHSYKGVSSDWRNWSPFVKKGGIIVFHDYYSDSSKGYPGLRRFIDKQIVPLAGRDFHTVQGLAWYTVR